MLFYLAYMANRLQKFVKEARARIGLDGPEDVIAAVGLFGPTQSGANMTHETSIRISTVYACVYKIASTLASLSLNLYVTDGRRRDLVGDHPALDVTTYRPNAYETAFYFWESIIAQAVLKGCGYAVIQRGAGGVPIGLICMDTDQVERRVLDGRVLFKLDDSTIIAQEDMLEICNLQRRSPIQLTARTSD